MKEYRVLLIDHHSGKEYTFDRLFKDRLSAIQYGQHRVDAVQLHNRWSFRIEWRDVSEWTPAAPVTDDELASPAVSRRMR